MSDELHDPASSPDDELLNSLNLDIQPTAKGPPPLPVSGKARQAGPPPLPSSLSSVSKRPSMPVPKGLPFALVPGERVVLREGFGGLFAWVWILCNMTFVFSCMGLFLVAQAIVGGWGERLFALVFMPVLLLYVFWPWVRSGRYWLTNKRLIWLPRWGKLQTLDLEEVDPDDIKPVSAHRGLKVPGESRKISIRYVRGISRLWGGIEMMIDAEDLDLNPDRSGVADVAWWPAVEGRRLNRRLGIMVLRPNLMAFLPTEANVNLAGDFLKQLGGKVIQDFRGKEDSAKTKKSIPYDSLLGIMSEQSEESFDEFIWDTAENVEGAIAWESGVGDITWESIPLRPSREKLVFELDDMRVSGLPPREQLDTVNRMLEEWKEYEEPWPWRYPYLKTSLITVVMIALSAVLYFKGRASDVPIIDLGLVSPEEIMDRRTVPDGAFVTVSGVPDYSHAERLKPLRKSEQKRLLVVFRESPDLILCVPEKHEISQALDQTPDPIPIPKKKRNAAPKEVAAVQWTISGRLHAADDPGDMLGHVPVRDVQQFAADKLKTDAASTRVLLVDVNPGNVKADMWIAYGFSIFLGVGAAGIICVMARVKILGRPNRNAAA
ncbi:hypothetical protein [Zavarzinella formosa]|uniref:hypothetical protein n=1 Tax=Zavarzinella formosa TaxID=360055 RepID=UPI0012FB66E7|nr:hypothetical protein [Zavarzinella formosa]